MPRSRLADLSTDHDLPVQRAAVLSLMFAVSAVLCVVAATTTEIPDMDVETLLVTAVVGGVVSVWLWWGRRRARSWQLQASLLLYSVIVAVLAALSTTANGVTSLGPAVIVATAYAGFFYARRRLWWQIAVSEGGYLGGAFLAGPPVAPAPMLTAMGAALALGLVLNQLTMLLRERSLLDPLTGVLNRATWVRIADGRLRDRATRPVTVAILDLDKFKHINDTLGHEAGDELLSALAAAWSDTLADQGLLGRYGGDEFVVLFARTDGAGAERVLARMRQAHPAPWTAGVVTARPGEDLTALLRRADAGLRSGKSLGPGWSERVDGDLPGSDTDLESA